MDITNARIRAQVARIMASAQARFGHGAHFMIELPTPDELVKMAGDYVGLDERQASSAAAACEVRLRELHLNEAGELRDLSKEEQATFDELMAARDRFANLVRAQDIFRKRPGAVKTAFGRAGRGFDTPEPAEVMRMSADDVRDDALRALEARGRDLAPDAQDNVDKLLRSVVSEDNPNTDGSYIARRILLTESDAYRSAWQRAVTQRNPLLTAQEVEALRAFEAMERAEFRAMAEGAGGTGGFGVPVFIDPTIIMTAQGSTDPILAGATRPQITTNVWKGVSSDGISWSFDPEASTVSDDSPTLAQPSIPIFTARGFVPFSIEVGEDYPGFASEMAALLGEGYSELLANKLTVGSGTAEPTGLLTALDADTTVEVLISSAGTLAIGDVTKVWGLLPDRFKGRASWLMSYAVADKVTALHQYTPNVEALQSLRGRPIGPSSYMTDLTSTAHTNVAVVGDLAKYVAPQRTGMSIELVPHLFDVSATNRPTGQRGWFAYARVGGAPTTNKAFRLLNQT